MMLLLMLRTIAILDKNIETSSLYTTMSFFDTQHYKKATILRSYRITYGYNQESADVTIIMHTFLSSFTIEYLLCRRVSF